MRAQKQKWTSEEEDALRAGVRKHGSGKWRTIQKDPDFSHCLSHRSNIDLKDKWRNISVGCGDPSSVEKVRVQKFRAIPAVPISSFQGTTVYASPKEDGSPEFVNSTNNPHDGRGPQYTMMIIEALTTMQEPNGSEIGSICRFIEQRHEVPQNFRKLLSSKLGRLVAQNKIEKVQEGCKPMDSSLATKTPTPKQKDPLKRPRPDENVSGTVGPTALMSESTANTAYRIADAEAKSFLTSEAVKKADKIARMANEADSLLLLIMEIFERCSRGEIVTIT